ncbi:MAG: sigma-70 family RNA polymerase sigma factor [Actinomycetota bacterium]
MFRIEGAIRDGLRQMAWLPRGAHNRAGRAMTSVVPVDFHAPRGEAGLPLHETLRDVLEGAVFDGVVLESEHREVASAIADLPDRERAIVVEHYYRGRRLKDIGRDLGVTESRICQLHRRALSRLQQALAPAAA